MSVIASKKDIRIENCIPVPLKIIPIKKLQRKTIALVIINVKMPKNTNSRTNKLIKAGIASE